MTYRLTSDFDQILASTAVDRVALRVTRQPEPEPEREEVPAPIATGEVTVTVITSNFRPGRLRERIKRLEQQLRRIPKGSPGKAPLKAEKHACEVALAQWNATR